MTKIIATVTNDLSFDQRMQRICSSLSESGFEVVLVGRKRENSQNIIERLFEQFRFKCFFEQGKLFYFEYNLRLFIKLLFSSYDIAYAVDLDTLVPVVIASKLKGKKIVFDSHEIFSEVPEVEGRKWVKKFWLWIESIFVKHADLLITVNDSLKQYFQNSYQLNFNVIRNVPELNLSLKTEPSTEKFLLYQGAVNKGRGLDILIDTVAKTDYLLKIAGEGDEYSSLKKKVKDAQINNIEFLGYLEPEVLKILTKKSYAGFNLLDAASKSYYYSLANKFYDYIAAGIPQISMSFPEYKKFNEVYEVSILIDDLDQDNILRAINELYENKELYERLKKNTSKAIQDNNWGQESMTLINLIKGVVLNK